MRRGAWPWVLGLALLVPAAVRAAEVDSTATSVSTRGTEEPLPRHTTALQWTGYALGWPIVFVTETATWPVEQLALAHEKSVVFRNVAGVLLGGVDAGPVRLQAFANYHSGEPLAELGLKISREPWRGEGGSLAWKLGWLNNRRNVASMRLQTPNGPLRFCLHVLHDNKPEREFYGVGPLSQEEESFADRRRSLAEARADWILPRSWSLGLVGYGRVIHLRDPDEDDDEKLSVFFPDDYAQARRSSYVGSELALGYDTRDRGAYSRTGNFMRLVAGSNWAVSGGDSDYVHASFEFQSFVDLYRRSRTLALRVYGAGIRADDPSRLPFLELERAGGRTGPRGYANDRFADRRQLVMTAEYRYRVTQLVRGAVFLDWGTVMPTWGAMRLADLGPSFGFGLELADAASLQIAFSDESVQFSFGSETIFSFRSRRMR